MSIKLSDRDLGDGVSIQSLSEMTVDQIKSVLAAADTNTVNKIAEEMGVLLRECHYLPESGHPLIDQSPKQRALDVQILGSEAVRERLGLVLRLIQ